MNKLLKIVCISGALSACGGGANDSTISTTDLTPDNAAANSVDVPVVQAANPYDQSALAYSEQQAAGQANETAQISVSSEFDFRTSKSVSFSLDFVEARDRKATVLICTDYSANGNSFRVNYDSCLLKAPINDGRLEQQLQILSRYTTVLGVLWFAEPGDGPLYQEIVVPSV